MIRKNTHKPIVVDLFSGCGGLSYGFEQAGFEVLMGIDSWGTALQTFAHNHPHAKIQEADVSKIKGADIKKAIGNKKVDVLVGGPPCQGFSLSGSRNFYDARNRLYLDFIRLVSELQPRAFVIENVPGLASLFGGQVKERIMEEFKKMGYTVCAQVLNASDYGVPQNRRRIIFVGLKGKKVFEFPEPTHFDQQGSGLTLGKKKVSVGDALSDLPLLKKEMGGEDIKYKKSASNDYQKLMRKGSNTIHNHLVSKHTQQTVDIISLVPEGGNYKDLPDHLIPSPINHF